MQQDPLPKFGNMRMQQEQGKVGTRIKQDIPLHLPYTRIKQDRTPKSGFKHPKFDFCRILCYNIYRNKGKKNKIFYFYLAFPAKGAKIWKI